MKKSIEHKYRKLIETVLEFAYFIEYNEIGNKVQLTLKTYSETDFTFEHMLALSKALNTKNINFTSSLENDGYCDTCSDPYSAIKLTISDIDLPLDID